MKDAEEDIEDNLQPFQTLLCFMLPVILVSDGIILQTHAIVSII